ncbi:MAG: hypothetical protein PHY47_18675 [Lachnospiraceae bacterium]|nr:hypothetical protein [Lachnospiraceae bacterium]
MEKTKEEYLSKLRELAFQAQSDGHIGISDFITKLISTEHVDIKVYGLILDYFDMLQDSDMEVYMFLLKNNVSASWYEYVEFLGDQRGSIIDYLPILSNCIANSINIEEMHDIEKNSKDIIEFKALVDAKILAKLPSEIKTEQIEKSEQIGIEKEFIEHLKTENEQLNIRLNNAMDELDSYRLEQKNMMETSISNKKAFMDHKIEAEHLKKDLEKVKSTLVMAEKKTEHYKEMICQLNTINDRILAEKLETEKSLVEMQTKLDSAQSDCAQGKTENAILVKQIETMEQQIANMRIASLTTSGIDEKVAVSSIDQTEDFEMISQVNNPDVSSMYLDDENDMNVVEELDYDPNDLIPIQNNKKNVEKHSSFLSRFINRHFEKKFEKKSQVEQDNLIFIKLMENEFSKEMVQTITRALRSNSILSRLELYKLISNKAENEDIINFCNTES